MLHKVTAVLAVGISLTVKSAYSLFTAAFAKGKIKLLLVFSFFVFKFLKLLYKLGCCILLVLSGIINSLLEHIADFFKLLYKSVSILSTVSFNSFGCLILSCFGFGNFVLKPLKLFLFKIVQNKTSLR